MSMVNYYLFDLIDDFSINMLLSFLIRDLSAFLGGFGMTSGSIFFGIMGCCSSCISGVILNFNFLDSTFTDLVNNWYLPRV